MQRTARTAFGAAVLAIGLLGSGALGAGVAVAKTALADLTGAQVCALVDGTAVGQALGVTVTRSTPSSSGTPQCSHEYRSAAGVSTNVVVAVSRVTDDLGGRTGAKAHAYAVKLNRTYAGKSAKFVPVRGIGTRATLAEGAATTNLIVATQDGRVMTVSGSDLGRPAAIAIAKAAATKLG